MLANRLFSPLQMHIPDGFLSLAVSIGCWILAAVGVGVALSRSRAKLAERQVPLMGVLAAFIFAAQMLNFTVAGGTSGHLVGGALAAILLGPWAGILTMTAVIGIQAIVFQDGGLVAMGANILNMGVVSVLVGYGIYRGVTTLAGRKHWSGVLGSFLASWSSVVVSSVACAVQLALSNTSPLSLALPAMFGIHILIGVGEGLITAGAVTFVAATRPDLVEHRRSAPRGLGWAAVGLGIAFVVVLFAPLASAYPDGLERVAEDLAFIHTAQVSPYEIMPDYTFPLLPAGSALATIAAGALGTLVVAGLTFFVARIGYRQRPNRIAE